jgi:mRNA deadenylase 3'-5' endonuclease subunit Ccr4
LDTVVNENWEINVTKLRNMIHMEHNHKHSQSLRGTARTFSILSYNVLCQQYINEFIYLYRQCQDDDLALYSRERVILKEIEYLNVDVMCIQELDALRYELFWKDAFVPWNMTTDCIYRRRKASLMVAVCSGLEEGDIQARGV